MSDFDNESLAKGAAFIEEARTHLPLAFLIGSATFIQQMLDGKTVIPAPPPPPNIDERFYRAGYMCEREDHDTRPVL